MFNVAALPQWELLYTHIRIKLLKSQRIYQKGDFYGRE
jgi:hypothetical protein